MSVEALVRTTSEGGCAARMSGFTVLVRPLHSSVRLKVMHANPDLNQTPE